MTSPTEAELAARAAAMAVHPSNPHLSPAYAERLREMAYEPPAAQPYHLE